ncbi:MAG: hypothetical protein JXQ99_27430 [Hyphomicrobiaceae bacterium]
MCFSATASFVSAGIMGVSGLTALASVQRPRAIPLAAAPLIFAIQQSVEGMLWLRLPEGPDGSASVVLTYTFLVFAMVFWPLYGPVAIMAVEHDPLRRRFQTVCLVAGTIAAIYLGWRLLTFSHIGLIEKNHIQYRADSSVPRVVFLLYLLATGGAAIASSDWTVRLFGMVVFLGLAVSYLFYWEALTSVWCFFAAAGSFIILAHFRIEKRHVERAC